MARLILNFRPHCVHAAFTTTHFRGAIRNWNWHFARWFRTHQVGNKFWKIKSQSSSIAKLFSSSLPCMNTPRTKESRWTAQLNHTVVVVFIVRCTKECHKEAELSSVCCVMYSICLSVGCLLHWEGLASPGGLTSQGRWGAGIVVRPYSAATRCFCRLSHHRLYLLGAALMLVVHPCFVFVLI